MAASAEVAPAPPWWRVMLIGRNPRRTLGRIVILAALCFFSVKFVILPIRVQGISMLPTYQDRRICLANRLAYQFGNPQRGDVVSIRLAGPHLMYLKRVVGLPGETVAFQDGKLLINGNVVAEPYVKLPCDWNIAPVEVGPNEYYVVGDNRSMPEQDHAKGRVERSRLLGKLLL